VSTPDSTLAAAVAHLSAEVDALRLDAEHDIDLATRLDTVEHDLAALALRVETLTALGPLGQSGGPAVSAAAAYQYPDLESWVDEVFARLAARHQARWCPRWADHLEAVARLRLLWRTWEAAHTKPANHHARDEWMRVVFDHHTQCLLDREGPFAGCTPDRCATAPRLPQRPTADPVGVVARLDAYRGAPVAHAGGARGPAVVHRGSGATQPQPPTVHPHQPTSRG
jgi:hypothetical protein